MAARRMCSGLTGGDVQPRKGTRLRQTGTLVAVIGLAGLLLGGGQQLALAQDSTGIDYSPNPEQCTQQPRPLDGGKAALVASPAGSSTSGPQSVGDFELPAGEEAPSDVRGGIVSTIVEIIACANARNQAAALAGLTEAFLESTSAGEVFALDRIAAGSGTPVALPEAEQTELLDTREFRVYDDGRAGVLVYYRIPAAVPGSDGAIRIDLLIFRNVDDRWLLDDAVTGLESVLGEVATPAAG